MTTNVPANIDEGDHCDVNPTAADTRCPPWCETDHAEQDRFSRYITDDGFTVMNLRHHSHNVAKIPNPGVSDDRVIDVDVSVTDDLDDGKRSAADVQAWGAECMTPETARQLAEALLRAAELAQSK